MWSRGQPGMRHTREKSHLGWSISYKVYGQNSPVFWQTILSHSVVWKQSLLLHGFLWLHTSPERAERL
ncbi:hypothetical protein X975_11604, partial [Stegodyphus mimosarum]